MAMRYVLNGLLVMIGSFVLSVVSYFLTNVEAVLYLVWITGSAAGVLLMMIGVVAKGVEIGIRSAQNG